MLCDQGFRFQTQLELLHSIVHTIDDIQRNRTLTFRMAYNESIHIMGTISDRENINGNQGASNHFYVEPNNEVPI